MGFRDESLWTGKTYAQWSLENTTEERLKTLQSTLESRLKSLRNSSSAVQDEVAYQTEQLGEQIQRGSADTVTAIQQMADYLGAELSEIRWAVERHTAVSEQMLKVLLSSLDNKSRQYWEQGVKCYDSGENEFAKERFEKALEANRTNSFAYEYLGFIAAASGNSEGAIRNFQLACKFATSQHHRALAFSHLARSLHDVKAMEKAANFSKAATEAEPENASLWYQHASYCVHVDRNPEMVGAVRRAIETDWHYWGIVATDPDFNPVRDDINRILDDLRERERARASQAIAEVRQAIERSRDLAGSANPDYERDLQSLEAMFSRNNVHCYRQIPPQARELPERVYSGGRRKPCANVGESRH